MSDVLLTTLPFGPDALPPALAATVLDQLADGVIVIDAAGRLVHVNAVAQVFRSAPAFICTLRGPQHIIELANDAFRSMAGDRDVVGRTWADRCVADPDVPRARDVTAVEREDHMAAFLADFAQLFDIIDEPAADRAPLMRDGSVLQHDIALRYGASRARLGWSEDALRREMALLRDEVDRTLRVQLGALGVSETEDALALVHALLREVGRVALTGWSGAHVPASHEPSRAAASLTAPAPSIASGT